jgi:LysR family glycine cleavage system transcriptional activator
VSRQIRVLEDWLGARLFLRTSRNAVPTRAGTDLLAEAGPALDRLAGASLRVQSGAQAQGLLHVSALPTFAMRWLIPRLPEFQRDHPALELRIVTASTAAEQFRMDVDAVISGPSRQPGWLGKRFLGEARLPLLSPDLMKRCPLQAPADLGRHTLLHAATLREAWPRWLVAAEVPDLRPARDQVFEHFYFAIQAALEGLGVVMGPLALVADELREGRLLAHSANRCSERAGTSSMHRRRLAMLARLPPSENGWLAPAAWRRPNIRRISRQIGLSRRSVPGPRARR